MSRQHSEIERNDAVGLKLGLCIGGVSLALKGDSTFGFPPELQPFFGHVRQADIEVNLRWEERLVATSKPAAFDSGALWTLFHDRSNFIFDFSSRPLGKNPYKRLRVESDFRKAQLTLSHEALGSHADVSPLEYPADELLFTNYLAAHGIGVEVHGCGLIDAETGGHLLLGHSGAGKSTTARLWQSLRNPEILSDDRLILRIENGELWMYGTPWHGEGQFASPGKGKLDRILILQHSACNQLTEMSRARAAGELFARSFPPFHSPEGLQRTMDFLDRVVSTVPCYEFNFVPDMSAVETVLGVGRESLIA